jgi:predicted XRE-type DNA-binding protein
MSFKEIWFERLRKMTEVLNDAANDAVFASCGNVFADLGLPSSPEDMLKIEISRAIAHTLRKRKLTQAAAAEIIGTDQAKVSALLKGRLKDFSADRLIKFLMALGMDVDIRLSGTAGGKQGRIRVSQAA